MRKSRFSEERIIGFLREQEAGAATAEVCREHGLGDATFYQWKARYGGLEVPEAKRLRTLEDENARLKRLLAEAMLDTAALKAGPRRGPACKKPTAPAARREAARRLVAERGFSQRRACRPLAVDPKTVRRTVAPDAPELRRRPRERRRFGYRRLGVLREREGVRLNHKKLYRLHRGEGLAVRRRRGRKRASARGSHRPCRGPKMNAGRWTLPPTVSTRAGASASW